MAERITINDVGPRDGLQNQATILTLEQRLGLINALLNAGLTHIEVGSFVSPKAVPAMAGTGELVAGLPRGEHFQFSALIPNRKGYDLAREAGIQHVGMVVAASDGMNQKNTNMPTQRALDIAVELFEQGKSDGMKPLAYIATAWECPYEGPVDPGVVIDIAGQLIDAGTAEIILADTIGAAAPGQVKSLVTELVNQFGADTFSCHFHDTRGMGVANVYAATEVGIRKFDASIGGLGGCPFAPGATGNVATEDVVLMLEQMGFDTGIDLVKLVAAIDTASTLVGRDLGGHSLPWLRQQIAKGALPPQH
ncbi:hydroxymethylglutaryl-CoA lyase [Spongiibacter nanhainus]|uniref:Hydroxymethylglutaryl-CoA lyase n=1 Tax=Spongiibacter nanhainus TaxID=2794344 RepID=A0A7T4UQ95_9GAMM|nr:hydroxymethylglutaryl-CoA lyase [Spongiibacter nanhainus]QQD17933.1 hydroxymethylglutaryl-CoA lyase [Spongiibacter nanhainus]